MMIIKSTFSDIWNLLYSPLMMDCKTLEKALQPAKDRLFSHPLYDKLSDITALKCFMSYHVFAVWDFMNLLTFLQTTYTSTTVPWQTPEYPEIARLVNEIKLEEESDLINGQVTSHFSFYLDAMTSLGVPNDRLSQFFSDIKSSAYSDCIQSPYLPPFLQQFLQQTADAIQSGPAAVAASFTFGRETIIPQMFLKILDGAELPPEMQGFKDYLERHIELDGESHGDLAMQLVSAVCGEDSAAWELAKESAKAAIESRITLYTGIQEHIHQL